VPVSLYVWLPLLLGVYTLGYMSPAQYERAAELA
jgi:hypothetical protein